MKTRASLLALVLCLVLSGCTAWPDGHYVSVKPHFDAGLQQDQDISDVTNYYQLLSAIQKLVDSGKTNLTISTENYAGAILEAELKNAIRTVCDSSPTGAYAVEKIAYEIGVTGGVPAISLTVAYNHNHSKITRVDQVRTMDSVISRIKMAIDSCAPELVLRVSGYQEKDFVQLITDYAAQNPNMVMEIPQITVNTYPEIGSNRMLEILFTYQNSRDSLRGMQSFVQQIFASSTLYVSGEEDAATRYDLLGSFLMERNDHKLETSLTPAYSLLRHGVGDSRAFAIVYEAMCRKAGLECMTVSGTKSGEQWFWNIICEDGVYYHLDLIESHRKGEYIRLADESMVGYVWDYSAYPACGIVEETPPEETTEPTQTEEETDDEPPQNEEIQEAS